MEFSVNLGMVVLYPYYYGIKTNNYHGGRKTPQLKIMFYQILNVKTDIDLHVIQFVNFMYPLKIFVKVVVYEIFKVIEHLST